MSEPNDPQKRPWPETVSDIPPARPVALDYTFPAPKPVVSGRLAALIDLGLFAGGSLAIAAAVMTAVSALHALKLIPDPSRYGIVIQIIMALSMCLLIGILLAARRRRFATIGWTADRLLVNAALGFAAWAGLVAFSLAVTIMLFFVSPEAFRNLASNRENVGALLGPITIPQILGLCAAVAFYEETIFRGFVLVRLGQLTGSRVAAVLISTAVFGSLHAYEGPVAMGMVSVLGLILCVIVLWRKSLVPAIVAHFLFNTGMMLMMRFAPRIDPDTLEILS